MFFSQQLPRLLTVAVAALVFVAGCSSGPRTQGSVTFDSQPVDGGGGIVFIPQGDDSGEARSKVTGEIREGRYDFPGRRSPVPGKYRVEITWMKKTGNKVPGEGGHPKDETQQVIPPNYNTQSELTVEIGPGNNNFDFDLKK